MPTIPKAKPLPWIKVAKPFEGMKESTGFYVSPIWRKFRKNYIYTNPLCVSCKMDGKTVQANVVDHIVPIANGGDRFDEHNLQSLCHRCHNAKSGKQRGRNHK